MDGEELKVIVCRKLMSKNSRTRNDGGIVSPQNGACTEDQLRESK